MEPISAIRKKYIKKIEEDKKNIQILSDDLFNLGLNMYSKEFSFDSTCTSFINVILWIKSYLRNKELCFFILFSHP